MPDDLRALASRVRPGMSLALPVDYAGVSMAMTRPLIDHGAGDLHLTCVPTGGLQVDQLIGAGLVRRVETAPFPWARPAARRASTRRCAMAASRSWTRPAPRSMPG